MHHSVVLHLSAPLGELVGTRECECPDKCGKEQRKNHNDTVTLCVHVLIKNKTDHCLKHGYTTFKKSQNPVPNFILCVSCK